MGGIKKFVGFPEINFGRTLVVLFLLLHLVLGGSRIWYKEEYIKISGKKRKIHSIWIKVDLCEVCLSEIIYYLLFYFKTILIPF